MTMRAIAALCLGVFMTAGAAGAAGATGASGATGATDAPEAAVAAEAAPAASAGHGVGGIFFKAKDPKALVAWYRDVLGLPLEVWGGAALRYDAPQHPPALIWNVLPATTKYLAPSAGEFMINYAVDDMDAFLARLEEKGVTILKRKDDSSGRFAWVLDPESNKIELWEPKHTAP